MSQLQDLPPIHFYCLNTKKKFSGRQDEVDGKAKTENDFKMLDVWLWCQSERDSIPQDSYKVKTKEKKVIHKSNTMNQSLKYKSANWLGNDTYNVLSNLHPHQTLKGRHYHHPYFTNEELCTRICNLPSISHSSKQGS